MDLRIIRSEEMKEQSWSFGTTKQIFISPENANYAERDFDYRFSLATIDQENATFSSLPGIQRFFLALSDVHLEIDGHPKSINKHELVEFSGDQNVVSNGLGTHFNLMVKNPKYRAMVNHLILQPGEFITERIQNNIFYYVFEGACIVKDFSFNEVLQKGDLITVDTSIRDARLKILSEKTIQLIRIDLFELKD